MNNSTLKRLVFDCAMELLHGSEELSNEEIGTRLLNYIELHDKSNPVRSAWTRVRPMEGEVKRHSSYNPNAIKPIQSPPKIKEIVIYADEVAIVYYTNGTCEHVGEVSYSDAIMIVEGDE